MNERISSQRLLNGVLHSDPKVADTWLLRTMVLAAYLSQSNPKQFRSIVPVGDCVRRNRIPYWARWMLGVTRQENFNGNKVWNLPHPVDLTDSLKAFQSAKLDMVFGRAIHFRHLYSNPVNPLTDHHRAAAVKMFETYPAELLKCCDVSKATLDLLNKRGETKK